MAAHAAPQNPRKGLRMLGLSSAGVAVAVIAAVVVGPMAAQAAPADNSTPASSSPAAAPQTGAPTTGSPAAAPQPAPAPAPSPAPADKGAGQGSASSDTPASTPSSSPQPAPAAPAPSPSPAPAPAAAPATSPSPSPQPAAAPAPQAKLTTQPKVEAAPLKPTNFLVEPQPATCTEGQSLAVTQPAAADLNTIVITKMQVNGEDVATLSEFLQKARGVAGDTKTTYDISAKPAEGYAFTSNFPFAEYSGPLAGPNTSLCPPPVTTVDNPHYAYTFNTTTGKTVVNVTGGTDGQQLTKPLNLLAAGWTIDEGATGNPPMPQTLYDANALSITHIGTFTLEPPQLCGPHQYDIYASYKELTKASLPPKLYGSHNPYEPAFLHEVLPGAGPAPTWIISTVSTCGSNPPPPIQVTPVTPEVPPLVCGEPGTWNTPESNADVIYTRDGNVLTAHLNNLTAVPLSTQGSTPTQRKVFGPLPAGWVLSESGNSATYTVVFPPVECPPNHGSDSTRATNCTLHNTVVTTTSWTQSVSWNGTSYTNGDKVYTKTVTTEGQNDTEKATCPILVVAQNPPRNPVETVSEVPSGSTLAHTGSDITVPLFWGIGLLLMGGIAVAPRWLRRKAVSSK